MAAKAYTSFTESSATKPRAIVALMASVIVIGLAASMGTARAQDIGDNTSIGASSGVNSNGSISINQVAGVGNQQSNESLVTNSPGQLQINQISLGNFVADSDKGSATIGSGAFAGASGLVQVSQASGAGNISANAAFVGVTSAQDALSPIVLSQFRGGFAPADPNAPQYDGHYAIASTAFAGSSGLVQVDQTVGNNNVTSNVVAVHVLP
jgi:hypothetical protein